MSNGLGLAGDPANLKRGYRALSEILTLSAFHARFSRVRIVYVRFSGSVYPLCAFSIMQHRRILGCKARLRAATSAGVLELRRRLDGYVEPRIYLAAGRKIFNQIDQ